MALSILLAVFLLAANAFFVAAEFALVKLKTFRIDALVEEGGHRARLTQHIHARLEPYLAACQLGITMASLGLGWVGEPTVEALLRPVLKPLLDNEDLIHTIAFLTGFITFSSLHIVVGEQVPKTFAIRKPEPVSLWIAYPLHWFYLLVFPLNWLLNWASASILRLFKVKEASHHEILSTDEIKDIIENSGEAGKIGAQKAEMLQNMFEFDSRTVEEIMVPRGKVMAIDLEDPWETQLETLNMIEHSRFPVTKGGDQHVKGVLIAKDFYKLAINGENNLKEKLEPLVREPLVVPETQKISKLFEQMRSERKHMAIVIDEYGAFAGMATMEDLLEEIVGEIADELDQDDDKMALIEENGYWQVDGWTQLADVERALDIVFPDELDANTISGLFMYRLARIPKEGDTLVELGYRYTIDSMTDRRVNLARIERAPREKEKENETPAA